jgi:hypothetical protein
MAIVKNANKAADPGNATPKQNAYAHENGIQPQYQVVLDVTGDDRGIIEGKSVFPIIASLPERYNISLSSQWDSPFANKSIAGGVFGENAVSAGIDVLSGTLGVGTRNQYQLAQVWQSTSPLTFNLDLVFNAVTNTKKDIMYKHLSLLKLVAPSLAPGAVGGMLNAPGPNLVASKLQGRNCSLQLGLYIKMDNIIVKSVSSDVQTICGADGIPHSMTINIEVESFYAGMTTQDIDKMFLGG